MTREEAIEQLKWYFEYDNGLSADKETVEAYRMAIKALEQESVLDKIKAEIEQLPIKTRTNWDGCCPDMYYPQIEYVDVTKKELLSIIDKYRKAD